MQAYCEGAAYKDNEIFKQLYDRFKYVSVFGNANIQNEQDWVKVIYESGSQPAKFGTWDAATKTCTGLVGLNIRFLTSKLGFESSLQKYIVGVEVAPIIKDWRFT
jgi:hypothetical protein